MGSLTITSRELSKEEVLKIAEMLIAATPKEKRSKLATEALKAQVLAKIGSDNTPVYRGKESYGHNPRWMELSNELWNIEGDMKLAAKSDKPIFDKEGVEVPAAKPNNKSASIKISW